MLVQQPQCFAADSATVPFRRRERDPPQHLSRITRNATQSPLAPFCRVLWRYLAREAAFLHVGDMGPEVARGQHLEIGPQARHT